MWILINTIRDCLRPIRHIRETRVRNSWRSKYAERLAKLKDVHIGEDCFIVGNGPSLNKMDLSALDDHFVFGLNKIHLIQDSNPVKLDYLVAVNDLVIEQSQGQFRKMSDLQIFLSYEKCRGVDFKEDHIMKLLTNAQWSFYDDVSKPISIGYTVTFVALQLAYHMGFQRVFLIGVDHNFQQVGKPNEKQVLEGADQNHFHPDYFKGMDWHLADLEGSEASFAMAKQRFHRVGREIFDATVGGKLQVFNKISFDQALEIANERR